MTFLIGGWGSREQAADSGNPADGSCGNMAALRSHLHGCVRKPPWGRVPFTMDSAARPDLLADGYILRRGLLQDFALNLFFGIAFLNLNARF